MPHNHDDRVINNITQLVSPEIATERVRGGAVLIDVRRRDKPEPPVEVAGAIPVDKARAEAVLDPASPDLLDALRPGLDTEIVVFCNSEFGSDPVVQKLNEWGYTQVAHIAGGYQAWSERPDLLNAASGH